MKHKFKIFLPILVLGFILYLIAINSNLILIKEYHENDIRSYISVNNKTFFNDVIDPDNYNQIDSVVIKDFTKRDKFVLNKEYVELGLSDTIILDDCISITMPVGWTYVVDTLNTSMYTMLVFESINQQLPPIQIEFTVSFLDTTFEYGLLREHVNKMNKALSLFTVIDSTFNTTDSTFQIRASYYENQTIPFIMVQKFLGVNDRIYQFNLRLNSQYYTQLSTFIDLFFFKIRPT